MTNKTGYHLVPRSSKEPKGTQKESKEVLKNPKGLLGAHLTKYNHVKESKETLKNPKEPSGTKYNALNWQ